MGAPCSKAHVDEHDAKRLRLLPPQHDISLEDSIQHLDIPSESDPLDLAEFSRYDMVKAAHILASQIESLPSDVRIKDSHQALALLEDTASGNLTEDEYHEARKNLMAEERALGFDHTCTKHQTPLEKRVNTIIQVLRRRDKDNIYRKAPKKQGHGGQMHERFAGDHFLSNVDLINQTDLMNVARHMPKGAHLHVHFNACLPPDVLLDIAKTMERMFITSDLALLPDNDHIAYMQCEIQFSLLKERDERPGNLFSRNYCHRQTMKFSEFLEEFPKHCQDVAPMEWLKDKLVFHEAEAHDSSQTAAGAWEKFNGRTRMMKGLFNYEKAYRTYTRLCLGDFRKDNIQYAEIRPNFMTTNQLLHDDGTGPIQNSEIMGIIIDEVNQFKADLARDGQSFGGLKVIYCTPRSFDNAKVKAALDECIEFKKRWPQWIAGFDLVGEEAKGYPLKQFIPEFLQFRRDCKVQELEIPFLFHCGETLELGTDTDGNLVDALLLGAKRIGHGFALTRHPYVMQQMRAKNICLELCPISNEILGLTPRVNGHAMYELLANNVHCTVNSDNGTLFRSTLSHDFYQVLIGKEDMGLAGWKQLVLWSIEHSCMDEAEKEAVLKEWDRLWNDFLNWTTETYEGELKQAGLLE